ncbi:WD repeat-containing protein CG11141 [Danaus plexippus]|uniref:WD repeat-containing protein CG11141 n=1 Tax=Danaus plexippus TaxID=13037 RepID=UPI002AB2DC4B|nr:WD repeat-containing protein CG11141 [Danaus plexippus]
MEVTSGAEEGFVREWTPCSHILNLIPARIQNGLFSNELCLTCVDAVSEYIALGTNVGLVYWYDRKKGNIQRLRCEASTTPITYVKIVSTVDYMVGAGNAAGQVTVFQIPKEHPENLPDNFKPKVEPKVERYTIGDLHKSKITAIEWSKNGMRLFSGDKNGVIIMTEIDFYMHLCKSMEIVNEEHEIVQMSYYQNALLVSSLYRSIVCERQDAKWSVTQLGKKERKTLCGVGAVWQHSYARGGGAAAYCARRGLRVWRADRDGTVQQTLLFKEAISNPLTVAELLNPSQKKHSHAEREYNFGPLFVFREHFLVSHNEHILYILDPRSLTAVAVVDDLRRILSVSVSREEVFVLEGPRSLVRLAHAPDRYAHEEVASVMSKSLSSSLQQAVSTVKELANMSVLEQPIAMFTRNETVPQVADAEECLELPPIKHLPDDISNNVLESIINEFRDVSSEAEQIRRVKSEELQRKLKIYNSIMDRKYDETLIHSSRRTRRRDTGADVARRNTSARQEDSGGEGVDLGISSCDMEDSVYGDLSTQNDELLEQQIEEKEKILAKMLNLESLSIKSVTPAEDTVQEQIKYDVDKTVYTEDTKPVDLKRNTVVKNMTHHENSTPKKVDPGDLVPRVLKLPNTWNLENIELQLDIKNGGKEHTSILSPDENLDSEWEVI